MRVVVAIENKQCPDRRLILPGAVVLEKEFVPVMFMNDQVVEKR